MFEYNIFNLVALYLCSDTNAIIHTKNKCIDSEIK